MDRKYRFRLVFFNCFDNKAVDEQFDITNAFTRRDYAEKIATTQRERENNPYMWEKGRHIRKVSTEGFYLVHESLFDELLAKHSKET